jgi:hypothetical protein
MKTEKREGTLYDVIEGYNNLLCSLGVDVSHYATQPKDFTAYVSWEAFVRDYPCSGKEAIEAVVNELEAAASFLIDLIKGEPRLSHHEAYLRGLLKKASALREEFPL